MFQLTEVSFRIASFDLHVLGTPPAFVLSQDQTLNNGISTAEAVETVIKKLNSSFSKEIFQSIFML